MIMTDWVNAAAAQMIENHDPIMARLSRLSLRIGQTPEEIMHDLEKDRLDRTFLGLLEMALEYWKGKQDD